MQQGYPHWLKLIALTIGIVGLAGAAAASDITGEESLATLVDDEGSLGAEAVAPTEVRIRPRLEAVDAATHQAMKAQAQRVPAPLARALALPSGPGPRVSVPISFTGLSEAGFIPPDTIVGKSNTRVLEGVNVSLRLFTTAGGILATKTLNAFFSAGGSVFFDPKVYYDRNAVNPRIYVVALQQSGNSDATGISRIFVAVSRSPDPPNLEPANWCRYNIDGKRNAGTANSSWADYAPLGVGADKGVITANQFRFTDDTFTYAVVRVFNKNIVSNNAAGCPGLGITTFQPSAVAGTDPFTLQPAQHYTSPSSFAGTSNPVYLVNSVNGTALYQVWRVRNLFPPTLQGPATVLGNFPHNVAPDAPQQGSAVLLDTGGSRVTQVAGRGNLIAAVNGTRCNLGAGNVSCVKFARFLVGQNAAGGLTAVINQQNTFGIPTAGSFIWHPGVALNATLDAAIPLQLNRNAAGAQYLSSAVVRQTGAGALANAFFINTGNCAQPFDRTGDYTGAQTDPSDNSSFWVAGERATVLGGSCTWQTQILKMQVP